MKRLRQNKSPLLSNSRWLAYAAAGAATALGGTHSAEAEIHYSGLINAKFSASKVGTFPLAPSAYMGFGHTIAYYSLYSKQGGTAFFAASAVAGFFTTCALNSSKASVSNLARNDLVSEKQFVPQGGILASGLEENCYGHNRGKFLSAGVGFIGFKFNTGRGDQYGWARIEMLGAPRNQFRLIDYAYGDPGDRLRVGEKHGGHAAIDTKSDGLADQGSLGLLALGGAGLMARRQRRT